MSDTDDSSVASTRAGAGGSSKRGIGARPGRTNSPHAREAFLRAERAPTTPPTATMTGAGSDGAGDDLLSRARGGDHRALSALLAEARPRALAVALKVLRNPDDAEDAVQDAFLKAWRNLFRFEGRSSFSTWIHRIVMNTSLDILRRQSCRPTTADEDEERPEQKAELEHDETPERAVVQAETARLVQGALAVLSPAHRQAVTLREFEEHSYEEIAQISACPVGTVMSRLHHARKKLADELAVRLADEPVLCAA